MDALAELAQDIADARREVIRPVIDQIAAELETALRAAGLDFPVCLSVPNSGRAIIFFVTPASPPDTEWDRATELLYRVVEKRFPQIRLHNRDLSCAQTNSKPAAAEITD